MQAGVEGAEAKAVEGVKLESTPAKHSVTIAHGGRTFVLKLNRTGGRGGEIRWPEGGGRMQIHMLPMSVHDHWRNYKGDANFKAWVTDPRYRVIIEPTDEERKLVK